MLKVREDHWVCTVCGKAYNVRRNLHRHVISIHLRPKAHVCPVCQRTFNYKSNLTDHLKGHLKQFALPSSTWGWCLYPSSHTAKAIFFDKYSLDIMFCWHLLSFLASSWTWCISSSLQIPVLTCFISEHFGIVTLHSKSFLALMFNRKSWCSASEIPVQSFVHMAIKNLFTGLSM